MAEWAGAAALRRALGEECGAARSLALKHGRDPSAVHRWLRGARPDPTLWPEIEEALNLAAGELRTWDATRGGVSQLDATSAELVRRIDVLQEQLTRLTGVVAEQRAKLDAQGVEIERLSTRGRRAAG